MYFQRVLSSKSESTAQLLSFVAAFGCIFMAVPAVFIGAIAKSTDWSQTEYARYGPVPLPAEDYKLVLPLVLQYLCPTVVGVIGKKLVDCESQVVKRCSNLSLSPASHCLFFMADAGTDGGVDYSGVLSIPFS